MQAHRLQRLGIIALLSFSALASMPMASAAPTFGSAVDIGATNQDNAYDAWASSDGQLVVIAHEVDSSGFVVVEVSSNGGGSFTTKPTGIAGVADIRVAAASATNIVVALCGSRTVIYTLDGTAWATSTGWTPATVGAGTVGSGGGGCNISYLGGTYVVTDAMCAISNCNILPSIGSGEVGAETVTSTNGGATWATPKIMDRGQFNGGTPPSPDPHFRMFSASIIMTSATAWSVYYTFPASCTPSSGAECINKIKKATTSNSGTTYPTIASVNDAFAPITNYGYNLEASDDGNALTFRGTSGNQYAAEFDGTFYYFTQVHAATVLGTSFSEAFSCSEGVVVVYQGASGDDRITWSQVTEQNVAFSYAVTGATSTTTLPFAAYRTGNQIAVVYGDLTDGSTLIKTTTNSACGNSVFGAAGTFCADPGEEDDYGYTYLEGVVFDDDGVSGINLQDSFVFTGDDSNFDYLAKSYDTGSKSFKAIVRLEASNDDATSSIFRVNFAETDGTLASSTTKGDGLETGHFSNHVEAELRESGNDWRMSVYYVIDGASGGARTKLGSSVLYGSPNTPTTFNVTVDSREGQLYLAVRDPSGTEIINRALPFIFQDDVWDSVWFVGYGANSILDSTTALDDNQDQGDDSDSTCIFDLLGGAVVNGPSGTTPGSLVPTFSGSVTSTSTVGSIFRPDGGALPPGFTDTTYDFFLGLLLMVMLSVGLFFAFGKSTIGAGIGGGMGFLGAFAFGLFPTWMLAVTVVIVIAIIFLGIRSKAAGN